jgi:hypothetical protein
MKYIISTLFSLVILPAFIFGQTSTIFMSNGIDWSDAKWSAGKPGEKSVAVITSGRTAIHSKGDTHLHTLRIGNNDAGGMLRLNGGTMTIANSFQLGTNGSGRSAVVHREGAVKVNRLALASNHSAQATAAYGIAAGSLEFNHMDVGTVGTGIFTVLGSAPERVRGMNIFLNGGVNSALEFILDAKGVRTIELSGRLEMGDSSTIRVDGTHFGGDLSELVLVDARSVSGNLNPEKIVFTNFPEGIVPSINVVRNQLILRLQRD